MRERLEGKCPAGVAGGGMVIWGLRVFVKGAPASGVSGYYWGNTGG